MNFELVCRCDRGNHQNHKNHCQYHSDCKKSFFNSAACAENRAHILAGQAAKANAFALQDNAGDQCQRSYNQRNLKISDQIQPPKSKQQDYTIYTEHFP